MNFKDYLALAFVLLQAALMLALIVATIGMVLGIVYGLTKQLFLFGLKVMA